MLIILKLWQFQSTYQPHRSYFEKERSTPQSVAAATIYFYLCLFPEYKEELGLSKAKFAEKAKLSDIIISKLCIEMASICKIAATEFQQEPITVTNNNCEVVVIKPKKVKKT